MFRIIIIIICFISTLILGLSFLRPQYQKLRNLQEDVMKKRMDVQTKEEYFSNLSDTFKEINKYKEQIKKIDLALPSEVSIPNLFDFVLRKTSQSGVILKKINLDSITPSNDFPELKEINLSLESISSYSSFKNFILSLEKSARLVRIERISFSSPQKEDESFSFELTIKVYSY